MLEQHRFDSIDDQLAYLTLLIKRTTEYMDEILAKLAECETKQDGFIALLNELKANQNDPVKLQAIAQSIDALQADWEAAFAVNTPEEVPAEVPAEEVPAEEVPAEEAPAEEVPAEVPAEEVADAPVDPLDTSLL